MALSGPLRIYKYEDKIKERIPELRFQDCVLTSQDGQSVYAKSLLFLEDLAIIEQSINIHDEKFPQKNIFSDYEEI
jgi:hypothetical protein